MQTPYTPGPFAIVSLERVAFYLHKDIGNGRVNGINNDTEQQRDTRRSLMEWILEVSSSFQNYCGREFLIQSRIEYFDVTQSRMEFFPKAVPVASITELANDPLGLFDGGESVIDSTTYHLGITGRSIEIIFNLIVRGARALRITYLGGLAYHAFQSTFTVSGVTGPTNIKVAYYAFGNTSEAIGKVVSYNDTTKILVLESIAGVFVALEALTFQPKPYAQDIASTGATIASIEKQSLCEAFPDLAKAALVEIRYMEKHENDFENESDGGIKSGASRRKLDRDNPVTFQPETLRILDNHRRYLVGS